MSNMNPSYPAPLPPAPKRRGLNALLIPFLLTIALLLGSLGFGVWAYAERQKYKNDTDALIESAVQVAVDKKSSEKDNEFLEKEKEPYRDFSGSDVLGKITYQYPKTWSGYTKNNNDTMEVYMSPGLVSGNEKTVYALKVTVNTKSYDQSLKEYESKIKSGKAKASAFRLAQLPNVLGTRVDGEIATGINGSIVVLPLRDKTITVSSESKEFIGDLDKIILPNFKYNP